MRNIYIHLIIIIAVTVSTVSCATQAPLIEEEITKKEDIQEVSPALPEEKEVQPEEKKVVPDEVVIETLPESLDEEELKEAETDIGELIEELNAIIASKDFISWKEHLSTDYVMYYSDPEVLKERTKSPLLTKYNIVLRTIEDYFNFVVVGSRQNVKLDEIKVLDRDRIKAYMFINNTPVIIYELVRIDGTWKIGKF